MCLLDLLLYGIKNEYEGCDYNYMAHTSGGFRVAEGGAFAPCFGG